MFENYFTTMREGKKLKNYLYVLDNKQADLSDFDKYCILYLNFSFFIYFLIKIVEIVYGEYIKRWP